MKNILIIIVLSLMIMSCDATGKTKEVYGNITNVTETIISEHIIDGSILYGTSITTEITTTYRDGTETTEEAITKKLKAGEEITIGDIDYIIAGGELVGVWNSLIYPDKELTLTLNDDFTLIKNDDDGIGTWSMISNKADINRINVVFDSGSRYDWNYTSDTLSSTLFDLWKKE